MDLTDLVAAGPAAQVEALGAGVVDARTLASATLARIATLDGDLNAFVSTDHPGALAAAESADRRRAAGERGPLLGVPIAIKDDLDAAGVVTGLGTRARTRPASADAEVVRRLRAAGAVVVGRTTAPELAVYGFTESVATGITRNPHDRGRTPGGSSGGSAAAVAAGMVGIATASDGAGSIRIPAACCGLPGFKPTTGSVPSPPGWYGLPVQGCLSRRLVDAATYLDVVGDLPDRLGEAVVRSPGRLRVGVDLRPFPASAPPRVGDEVAAAVLHAADRLAEDGHHVRDVRVRWGAAAQAFSLRYLGGIHASAATVDDPALLEPRTRQVAALGGLVPPAWAGDARRAGLALGQHLLADTGVDVLLTPTMRGPAVPVGRWDGRSGLATVLSMGRQYAWTPGWNHTGCPAVTLPWGTTDGDLPVAVQLVAPPGHDARLLSVAATLERRGSPWPGGGVCPPGDVS